MSGAKTWSKREGFSGLACFQVHKALRATAATIAAVPPPPLQPLQQLVVQQYDQQRPRSRTHNKLQ